MMGGVERGVGGAAVAVNVAGTALAEVGLLRLAAQRIAGPGMDTPTEAVRWLAAAQAQDHGGMLCSIALRTASRTRQAVEAAFTAGEIVKSWPMRGTLHVVAAEDLPGLLSLTAPRVVAGAASRRAGLGLDLPLLERARTVALGALAGGGQFRREDLYAVWDNAGLSTAGQRGYHMLWHLAQTGTLCFGPIRDGGHLLVLVDEWIARPRLVERDEMLGDLAARYFRGHGPATVKDFTRWTKLTAADVRTGLALARPRLAHADIDGVEYLMDPETPDRLAAWRSEARGVFLLPGFDELMLGYADRGAMLPTEFADRIVPGGNGMFRPTVVHDGRVVGTWKRSGRGSTATVTATPFTTFPAEVVQAIPLVYATVPQ
jgi:Winged helix DNA-binding domain